MANPDPMFGEVSDIGTTNYFWAGSGFFSDESFCNNEDVRLNFARVVFVRDNILTRISTYGNRSYSDLLELAKEVAARFDLRLASVAQ